MPKEKSYLGLIPKIYKRNYEDISMFFFVEGQRMIIPALTIERGILNYFRYAGIDDFNLKSALTTYIRLRKEWYENAKEDN